MINPKKRQTKRTWYIWKDRQNIKYMGMCQWQGLQSQSLYRLSRLNRGTHNSTLFDVLLILYAFGVILLDPNSYYCHFAISLCDTLDL